jgi:hypothetical protein
VRILVRGINFNPEPMGIDLFIAWRAEYLASPGRTFIRNIPPEVSQ